MYIHPILTNKQARMKSLVFIVFFFFFLVAALTTVSATDHIVGANKGWNPGINYTIWANNQTFFVGDLICTDSYITLIPFFFFFLKNHSKNNILSVLYSL